MELSAYLKAEAKRFNDTCGWCGSPLELVSLEEIGVKLDEHNGLIRCTNPECDYVSFWMTDPELEEEFNRTGKLREAEIINFDDLEK